MNLKNDAQQSTNGSRRENPYHAFAQNEDEDRLNDTRLPAFSEQHSSFWHIVSGLVLASVAFGMFAMLCTLTLPWLGSLFGDIVVLDGDLPRNTVVFAMTYTIIGLVASVMIIPLLLLLNSRSGLSPHIACGVCLGLGLTAWIVFTAFSDGMGLPLLGGLSARWSAAVVFAWILFLPCSIAGVSFGFWIARLRKLAP